MARPRDEAARQRIIDSTRQLVASPSRATMADIAADARVGVQTIYRWWPSRTALIAHVLAETAQTAMPYAETGDVRTDLRNQMRSMIRAFKGETGALIKEVIADAQTDDTIRIAFKDSFFSHRRQQAHTFLQNAIDRGQLPPTDDLDGLMHALYAPLWLAFLTGHEPLNNQLVDRSITAVLGSSTE